ncbi:MAG TPA: SelT/SelW/SelH family protein [Chloroflexi bacterium]|nr:SelT/SelW/SelH family protein [Chloroflexota bacterium]
MTDAMLQEFEPYIESWTLIPSDGGRFEIEVNGKLIYSKLKTGRHAEIDEIRQAFREMINRR